jgi:hypothetical protein
MWSSEGEQEVGSEGERESVYKHRKRPSEDKDPLFWGTRDSRVQG